MRADDEEEKGRQEVLTPNVGGGSRRLPRPEVGAEFDPLWVRPFDGEPATVRLLTGLWRRGHLA